MADLRDALGAVLLAFLSLAIWRLGYGFTDWAALGLMPLAAALLLGGWRLGRGLWRARLLAALREASPLGRWLTGHLRAALGAVGFAALAVAVLAWQALGQDGAQMGILAAAFAASALLAPWAEARLARHLHPPFAAHAAAVVTTLAVAAPTTLILAGWIWAAVPIPAAWQAADLAGALDLGLARLPAGRGWMTAALSLPFGYEAVKLWLVVQLRDYAVVGLLYSLDAALVSLIVCRAAILVQRVVAQLQVPR